MTRLSLNVLTLAGVLSYLSPFNGLPPAPQWWRDAPPSMRGLFPGWTGLVDPMGHCRFSVPAAWKTHDADRLAFAPDGAATAAEEWAHSSSWTRYRTDLYRVLKPTVLLQDSSERLWFEYDAGWAGIHHYVAVPARDGACVLRIDMRTQTADKLSSVVGKIAGSLVALP
jgi:hypothetical protein